MTEHTALRFEQHLLDEWGKSFHDFSVFGCDEYGCQYADHEVNRLWLIWIHRQKEVDRLVEALQKCVRTPLVGSTYAAKLLEELEQTK